MNPCFILPNGELIGATNHWRDFIDHIYWERLDVKQKKSFNAMLKRNGDPPAYRINTYDDDVAYNTGFDDLYEWCAENQIVCVNDDSLHINPKDILDAQVSAVLTFFKRSSTIYVEYQEGGKRISKELSNDEFVESL
jgi:hypothetical protein